MKLSFMPSGSANRYLGVDIGHDNIKVVEVEIVRDRAKIINAGMEPTPIRSVVEGQVLAPDLVSQAIKDLIARHGMTAREAIGSVTGSSVVIRPIGVPRQKPADLAQSIVFEAQKWVSTTPAESYFESPILPDPPGVEPGEEMAVLLVVAPRNLVDSRVLAMELAGLEVVSMDVNAMANIRSALPTQKPLQPDEVTPTIALVDLGASYTEVTIVQGHVPVLPRTINIGGTSFTNALAGVLGIDFEEAQKVKQNLDIEAVDETSSDATAGRVIHSLLEELVRDIRRSMAYYASTVGWENIEGLIDRVILLGGGSALIHTASYFANVLQMNVVIGDLPSETQAELSGSAFMSIGAQLPSYLTAIGLGMWPLYAGRSKK
jgi:type IV pilus assembly protein PilM